MSSANLVSIIIPTYNEDKMIVACLKSLLQQVGVIYEILIVDDGSVDKTLFEINEFINNQKPKQKIKIINQNHKGPGEARNLAASHAKGSILVFIDADMTFEKSFIKNVIKPIQSGRAIGTDSQSGIFANPKNYWARCWNLGKFAAAGNYTQDYLNDITPNKRNYGGVFRAILKDKFNRFGGFEKGGDYTDDTSLGRKLGKKATIVTGAIFYHWNPDSVIEVWMRSKWIGSSKNFTGTTSKKVINIFKFFPPLSIIKGIIVGQRYNYPQFFIFKVLFDTGIWYSVIKSI